jgi:RNase P/RNase MRP subunit POP5
MPVRDVRRRYLYVKVSSGDTITEEPFINALYDKVHFLYGVTGGSAMSLRLIEWDDAKQAAIVRVHNTMLTEARAAIAHIQEISMAEVRLDVARVSGTIKTLKSKL